MLKSPIWIKESGFDKSLINKKETSFNPDKLWTKLYAAIKNGICINKPKVPLKAYIVL